MGSFAAGQLLARTALGNKVTNGVVLRHSAFGDQTDNLTLMD